MNSIISNALPMDTKDPAKLFTRLLIQKLHTNFGEGSYSNADIEQINNYGEMIFLKSDKIEKIIAYVNLFYSKWNKSKKVANSLLDKFVDGRQYNFVD